LCSRAGEIAGGVGSIGAAVMAAWASSGLQAYSLQAPRDGTEGRKDQFSDD
jgi:hypothetical protein